MELEKKTRIVVLGTGFAAVSFLKSINTKLYEVVAVSPRNHFLFTPLLPSTTVGTIEFRSIIEPIRVACPDVQYYHARCTNVDLQKKLLACEGAIDNRRFELNYNILVIAVGARSNTYGIPGVREHALFLKELSDARAIRQRIIECFEQAAQPTLAEEERKHLLHFVVVGGGPTGVEIAAEMYDLLTEDLRKSYRSLMPFVRITLLEATDQILSTFDTALSVYTMKLFQRQNIEVRTGSPVKRVKKEKIILRDGSEIPYGMVVWSTGIGPTDLVLSLPFLKDRTSRLVVNEYLQVKGLDFLYALGDCAAIEDKNFPATAQVAQQQGKYLAHAFNRRARGKPVPLFHYRHYGMLAYIGSGHALADLAKIKGKGFSAWLLWRSAYVTRLLSLKNRILVLFDWFKAFVFGRDTSRF